MPGPPKERKTVGHGALDLIPINKDITDEDLASIERARNVYRENGVIISSGISTASNTMPHPKSIEIGGFHINCWHTSVYPEKYARLEKLILCEICLASFQLKDELDRHLKRCMLRHPPGLEVYRKGDVSIFEVRGQDSKQYCQNLCMLGKLFLDHKVVYRDVHHFLFYVLTKFDRYCFKVVGYFSKENLHEENLSCIVVLPPYLSGGYGRLLIDFSYLLSKVEGKVGTPEKPLSDMGSVSYLKYWKTVFMNYLMSVSSTTRNVATCRYTICEMERLTAICRADITETLSGFSTVENNRVVITVDWNEVIACIEKQKSYPADRCLDKNALKWNAVGGRAGGMVNHLYCGLCPPKLTTPIPPPPPPPRPQLRKRRRYR